MNKYQTALNALRKLENPTHCGEPACDLLQLIVNHEEPMKPIENVIDIPVYKPNVKFRKYERKTVYHCPTCGAGLGETKQFRYCPDCGQKLDWGKSK